MAVTMQGVLTVDRLLCNVAGFLEAKDVAELETTNTAVRATVLREGVWAARATGVSIGLRPEGRVVRRWKMACLRACRDLSACFHAFPEGCGCLAERTPMQEWHVSQARAHINMINTARDCFAALEKHMLAKRKTRIPPPLPPHLYNTPGFHPYGLPPPHTQAHPQQPHVSGHNTSPSPTPPGSLRRVRVKPHPPTPPALPLGPFFP